MLQQSPGHLMDAKLLTQESDEVPMHAQLVDALVHLPQLRTSRE